MFQNRRWDTEQLALLALLEAGRSGTVHRFERRWERFRPVPQDRWKENDPLAGGLLLDLGAHLVDSATQLFGPVASVYAELHARTTPAVDDVFLALTHAYGVISHLQAGAVVGAPGPRTRVLGDAGAYLVTSFEGEASPFTALDDAYEETRRPGEPTHEGWLVRGAERVPVPRVGGGHVDIYRAVAAWVVDGGPPPVDPFDAARTARVLDAARVSADEGRVVRTALTCGRPPTRRTRPRFDGGMDAVRCPPRSRARWPGSGFGRRRCSPPIDGSPSRSTGPADRVQLHAMDADVHDDALVARVARLRGVRHEHLARLLDATELTPGRIGLLVEHVDGLSLAQIRAARAPLSDGEARDGRHPRRGRARRPARRVPRARRRRRVDDPRAARRAAGPARPARCRVGARPRRRTTWRPSSPTVVAQLPSDDVHLLAGGLVLRDALVDVARRSDRGRGAAGRRRASGPRSPSPSSCPTRVARVVGAAVERPAQPAAGRPAARPGAASRWRTRRARVRRGPGVGVVGWRLLAAGRIGDAARSATRTTRSPPPSS